MWMQQTLKTQRKMLEMCLEPPLRELAEACAVYWEQPEKLDRLLYKQMQLSGIPECRVLYVLDKTGKQISADISATHVDLTCRGRDAGKRPYALSLYPKRHFAMSAVYLHPHSGRPGITALQPVCDRQQFLGFVAADLELRDPPLRIGLAEAPPWRRAVQAARPPAALEGRMDEMLAVLQELLCERGVFQCGVHYSSSQAILWHVDNPWQYHVHALADLLDPALRAAYRRTLYPWRTALDKARIRQILERFAALRVAGERVYLRSASLNIVNGMVGLTFSCDGSHYLPGGAFLEKDLDAWLGDMSAKAERLAPAPLRPGGNQEQGVALNA